MSPFDNPGQDRLEVVAHSACSFTLCTSFECCTRCCGTAPRWSEVRHSIVVGHARLWLDAQDGPEPFLRECSPLECRGVQFVGVSFVGHNVVEVHGTSTSMCDAVR